MRLQSAQSNCRFSTVVAPYPCGRERSGIGARVRLAQGVRLGLVRCAECGKEADVEAHAAGWLAYRVDLPDDPDPPGVAVFCPECAAKEFGRSKAIEKLTARRPRDGCGGSFRVPNRVPKCAICGA